MQEEQENIQVQTETEAAEVSVELKNIIETLIFASDEPISTKMIRAIIEDANKERASDDQLVVNAEIIRKCITELNRGYGKSGAGFRIIEIAAAFTYATMEPFAAWVGRLHKEKIRRRLSATAVETLAIIAYKQPITKVEVEFIRGVNVDYIMKTLLEKNLIRITGRQNSPGRPLLYGTTDDFLMHFGLNDLHDLPKPREIEELIGETEAEVDRRILAEQQQLEFKEELDAKFGNGEEKKSKPAKEPKQPQVKVKVPQEVIDEKRGEEAKQRKVQAEQPQETIATTDTEHIVTEIHNEENAESKSTLIAGERGLEGELLSENLGNKNETADEEAVLQPEEAAEIKDKLNSQTTDEQASAMRQKIVTGEESSESLMTTEDSSETKEPLESQTRKENLIEATEAELSESQMESGTLTETKENEISEIQTTRETLIEATGSDLTNEEASDQENLLSKTDSSDSEKRETGWSKWKNKVKTFFQKLFA